MCLHYIDSLNHIKNKTFKVVMGIILLFISWDASLLVGMPIIKEKWILMKF